MPFIKKILLTALILFLSINLYAEYLFLKDGSIIKGTIISDGAAVITVRMEDRNLKRIPRSEIMRVLYTDLKLSKIYIQKRDGKGLVAYIVDEDRETYTFRTDLYKPDEFVLKRSDILFISEKNPSGLQVDGEVGTDSVKLKWHPPYDEVKKYNIYIKENEKDKYELAESSKSRSATIKNLASNTTFYIIVTSVDMDNYESSPSNELIISTANILPEPPVEPASKKTVSPDGKTFDAVITWNPAIDPDGKVVHYEIWNRKGEPALIDKVTETSYILKQLNSDDIYSYAIRSVDDKGGMSSFRNFRVALVMPWHFSLRAGAYVPLGELADYTGTGYGSIIAIERSIPWEKELFIGMESGCLYFPGSMDSVEGMFMVPAEMRLSWRHEINNWFFSAGFTMGGTYSRIEYYTEKDMAGRPLILTASSFDPSGSLLFNIAWAPFGRLMFGAGAEYRAAYEKSGMLHSIGGGISCGYRF